MITPAARLTQMRDTGAVTGWSVEIRAAYGQDLPILISRPSWAGLSPETHDGLTWQLIVKANRSQPDAEAIINYGNANLDLRTNPLSVGVVIDTKTEGFAPGGEYFAEVWVADAPNSIAAPVLEARILLIAPARKDFA